MDRRAYLDDVSRRTIGCAHRVSNCLGSGFLEKVYENALALELRHAGMAVQQQHPITVIYKGEICGAFNADLLVQSCVLVELKATKNLKDLHAAQCMNYLKATQLSVCLLINFGEARVSVRRIVRDF